MNDEQAIRDLIATWHRATAAGDLPRILELMSEDVVFLTPGQPPMRGRDAFAKGFQTVLQSARIEPSGEIQEVEVAGDWAYCWTYLSVTITPRASVTQIRRAGHTLDDPPQTTDGSLGGRARREHACARVARANQGSPNLKGCATSITVRLKADTT